MAAASLCSQHAAVATDAETRPAVSQARLLARPSVALPVRSGACRFRQTAAAIATRRVLVRASAADADSSASPVATTTPAAASASAGSGRSTNREVVPDSELSITKTSFGTIGLTVGVILLSYGFGAYFSFLPGSSWSAIMLTYGFPLALIGFALKYAELKPVECVSYADAVALREKEATAILQQVRSDVTRYRYGDEQHLEEALKRIFRYNLAGGIQRRNAPTLTSIAEEVYDGRYSLLLRFSAPALDIKEFKEREAKFASFFGPGVRAVIEELGPKEYGVRLVVV